MIVLAHYTFNIFYIPHNAYMTDIEDKISLEIAFKSRKLPPDDFSLNLSIWIKIYTYDLKLHQCSFFSLLYDF